MLCVYVLVRVRVVLKLIVLESGKILRIVIANKKNKE